MSSSWFSNTVFGAVFVILTSALAAAQAARPSTKAEELSAAARRGDAAAVRKLLDEGVDPNTKFRYDVTALTYAIGLLKIVAPDWPDGARWVTANIRKEDAATVHSGKRIRLQTLRATDGVMVVLSVEPTTDLF